MTTIEKYNTGLQTGSKIKKRNFSEVN